MIKIRLEHNATGNGLGYQISSYVLLKSLAKHFGYEYGTDEFEFLNLRSTFEGVSFDGTTRHPQKLCTRTRCCNSSKENNLTAWEKQSN
jgi:hypothetical protein